MEGEMLKGKFTRKDNNKVLTTTRAVVGGELVQVSKSIYIWSIQQQYGNLSLFCKLLFNVTYTVSSQTYNYEGVDAKRIFKKEWTKAWSSYLIYSLHIHRWHSRHAVYLCLTGGQLSQTYSQGIFTLLAIYLSNVLDPKYDEENVWARWTFVNRNCTMCFIVNQHSLHNMNCLTVHAVWVTLWPVGCKSIWFMGV